MNFTSTGARAFIAVVAIMGATGTAATTASAKSATHAKATATHPKKPGHAKKKAAEKVTLAAKPDLLVQGLDLQPSDDGFDVQASVVNDGKALAKSSDVVIALSDDTTLDDNDELLDEYALPSIAPGVTRSFDDDVELPDDIGSGTSYILVCADGNEDVTESNETNNCVSQEIDTSDDSGTDGSSASDDGSSASDDGSADDGSDPANDDSGSGAIVLTGGQS